MPQPQDWSDWYIERKQFQERDAEGFTRDLEALERHIKKLAEVAPKDKAGWPVNIALLHIGRLTKEYDHFKNWRTLNVR